MQRAVGKAVGDERIFIPDRRARLADEAGFDAIPEATGSEGDHGVKPDAVIHRYLRRYLASFIWKSDILVYRI